MLLKTSIGGRWAVPLAEVLQQRGHDVVFALPSPDGPLPELVRHHGMSVVRAEAPLMGAQPWRQPTALRRLRRQLAEQLRADVVVSHLYASAVAGRLATARTGIAHVFMSAGPLYLENGAIRRLEKTLNRLDDHIICSSGAIYEAYRRLGVTRERLSLIPYTVDPSWGPPTEGDERAAARRSLGLNPSDFVCICVALFYPPKRLVHRGRGIKGHDVLLDAWGRFQRGGGRGQLLLVGGGFGPGGDEYRAALRARYEAVPGVTWVETVPDVRPYYLAADVSVSPSLSENLGAPAEAGALGVPSIASHVGGLPEIVVDGWSGWLVSPDDPGDLAATLAAARDLGWRDRVRFGERARLRVSELMDRHRNGDAFADVVERAAAR